MQKSVIEKQRIFKWGVKFEPRDVWVGAFWDRHEFIDGATGMGYKSFELYVCLIPLLPIYLKYYLMLKPKEEKRSDT